MEPTKTKAITSAVLFLLFLALELPISAALPESPAEPFLSRLLHQREPLTSIEESLLARLIDEPTLHAQVENVIKVHPLHSARALELILRNLSKGIVCKSEILLESEHIPGSLAPRVLQFAKANPGVVNINLLAALIASGHSSPGIEDQLVLALTHGSDNYAAATTVLMRHPPSVRAQYTLLQVLQDEPDEFFLFLLKNLKDHPVPIEMRPLVKRWAVKVGNPMLMEFARHAVESMAPPHLKMTLEMELTEEPLSRLIRFFKLEEPFDRELISRHLNEFDEYLEHAQAFAALPEDIKFKLTEGKALISPIIYGYGYGYGANQKLVIAGHPEEPISNVGRYGRIEVPHNTGAQIQWAEVKSRWKKLSNEEKLRAIQPEYLSDHLKAKLIIEGSLGKSIQLKSDIPSGIQSLLQEVRWQDRGGAVNGKVIFKQAEDYLSFLNRFGKLVGTQTSVEEPLGLPHQLFVQAQAVPGYSERVEGLRELLALRGGGRFVEDSSTLEGLDLKGDHFEIRARLRNPVEEVPELLNFFAKEKSEALHWIKSKMSEMTHEKDASLKATLSLPDCLKNRRIPSAP